MSPRTDGIGAGAVRGPSGAPDLTHCPCASNAVESGVVVVGEVLDAGDASECVTESEVGVAIGGGGAGDAGVQLGDVRDGAGLAVPLPERVGFTSSKSTRSQAEGDSRSAANKVPQHESRASRYRARGNPGRRVGVVGPEHRRAADLRTPPIYGRRPKLTRDVVERIAIRLHDESPAFPGSRRR